MAAFGAARHVLRQAVASRAFPSAVIEVGNATQPLLRESFGRLTFDPDAQPTQQDTIFDLASLTKALATTPIVMQQVERGILSLEDKVADRLPGWKGADREQVTIRDLLAHSSGLTAYLPLYKDHQGRQDFEHAICTLPLEYAPRTASIYSDLGFILLGFIVEDAGSVSLGKRFDALRSQIATAERLQYEPPRQWKKETAPTEQDPWRGRLLVGEVHDENAWALGGVAAHAGLFGTAAAVGDCARHLLQILSGRMGAFSQATLRTFVARWEEVPGSSRALGWDTMLPTSSCGTLMSPHAFGHRGFTGTSLWIDPDRGVYAMVLTNRIHPTRKNEAIRGILPVFHDAVMTAVLGR